MTATPRRAGGKATEAGMSFQAAVASWFAAHMVAHAAIGGRFGLPVGATPLEMRQETGRFLDDIVVRTVDDHWILVQCKTSANLSPDADSPLGKTVDQLVQFATYAGPDGPPRDPDLTAAVLAVLPDASERLDDLEAACRYFDHGAAWGDHIGALNQRQAQALSVFEGHARRCWLNRGPFQMTDEDLVRVLRLFHVVRFSVEGGPDAETSTRLLGAGLFGSEGDGAMAYQALLSTVRRLMVTGAPADRRGIVQALRRLGVVDTRNPPFDEDFEELLAHSERELARLHQHTVLPFGDGIPVARGCEPSLKRAVEDGSLLIIGEPGAGKTGVLVNLAKTLKSEGTTYLLLSVDRLAGAVSAEALQQELRLSHRLTDVLEAWPGEEPCVLIVDALDATRGGPSELVFANLIEDLLMSIGDRWSIVASIRTFDLTNGQRFRKMMAGAPPFLQFSEPTLRDVRHFLIPRLNSDERSSISREYPDFARAIEAAPGPVQSLLGNIFNLSLAADLIQNGAFESLGVVRSQSDLIDRYEDLRLNGQAAGLVVKAVVAEMVSRRSLTVLKWQISESGLDQVLQTGVIVAVGDRVAFAHHVLFDHAAGRYFLDSTDHRKLITQITDNQTIGFLLGPGVKFAMERMWWDDGAGKSDFWRFIITATTTDGIDPILSSIALRSAAEKVETPQDMKGLILEVKAAGGDDRRLGRTFSRLARFARMALPGGAQLTPMSAMAWAQLATALLATGKATYLDAARAILIMLDTMAPLHDDYAVSAFGLAARDMLARAWQETPAHAAYTTVAIRCVCATFKSSPETARDLLSRMFENEHFHDYAHLEAPAIAEGVRHIIPSDPSFALTIYSFLFGRPAPQSGQSWLGGQPSQLVPLTADKRQDYEHARYHLAKAFPTFLELEPGTAVLAASAAALGKAGELGSASRLGIDVGHRTIVIFEDYGAISDWGARRHTSSEDILPLLEKYLRTCSQDQFATLVRACADHDVASSVWARLLGIGAERVETTGDLLWPFASAIEFLDIRGLTRDAIRFLRASFPKRIAQERLQFERDLSAAVNRESDGETRFEHVAARFLFGMDAEALLTEDMRGLHRRLTESQRLEENRPYSSMTMHSGEVTTDYLLERSGIDIGLGDDAALREVTRPLEALLKSQRDTAGVAGLWRGAVLTIEAIDRLTTANDTVRAAWAAVGEAVEKIAEAEAFSPGADGHPGIENLLPVIDRLATSEYPRADEGDDGMSWGNWDIRVYAGSAMVALIPKLAAAPHRDLIPRLRVLLDDPSASVRLQVARSLNALYEVAREDMWDLIERVARHEPNRGVLAMLVGGPLAVLAYWDQERTEAVVSTIIERVPDPIDADRERADRSLVESLGNLAAHQWVGRARPAAKVWIDTWLDDLVRGRDYLWSVISPLRQTLFLEYSALEPDNDGLQRRAHDLVDKAARKAEEALSAARSTFGRDEIQSAEFEEAQELFRAGDGILDHIGSQLYFGSGAYQSNHSDEVPGLINAATKADFLADYADLLDTLGRAGTPHTLYQLFELYEFLVDADPQGIFERISGLLVGPGAREHLHFESLASDGIVRLVRRYLADYRHVFADVGRRSQLLAVLELFSDAGWPDALNLLYELPDLLR